MKTFLPAALAALALAVYAAPGAAGESDLDALAEKYNENVKNPDEEVICRKEQVIGSRIPKKVCRTRGQIEQDRKEAQRYMKSGRPAGTNNM